MNRPRSADFSPQEATLAKGRRCGLKPALLIGSSPSRMALGPRGLSRMPAAKPSHAVHDRPPGERRGRPPSAWLGARALWRLGCLLAVVGTALELAAADPALQAGVSRIKITPPGAFWMSGYAARKHPSEGVLADLWAKALALRDPAGQTAVIVTTDLIGLPGHISADVMARVKERFGLDRSQVLLNSSHTHSGPAVGRNLSVMFDFNAVEAGRVEAYSTQLTSDLVTIIGEALKDVGPAQVTVGHGRAGFAINRREPTTQGVRIGVNTAGPVDHDVPVLKVTAPDGRLRAVLFGYACHNTTLGGDFYQINGDYAGFAQAEFETAHPGATALFLMLCGGDQNPNPRGTVDHARRYGSELATEVARVVAGALQPVRPPIRTASSSVNLEFAPHTRETFEQEAKDPDVFRQRRAKLMLEAYDRGAPVRHVAFPLQAIRFNGDLTLLALGGEVVVGYGLRAKKTYPKENLVVSGYCHDVMCYIPTRRVLEEGGYEPVTSMIYYGQPGPFTADVEETIFTGIDQLMQQVGAAR